MLYSQLLTLLFFLQPQHTVSTDRELFTASDVFVDGTDYGLATISPYLSVCQCDSVGECINDQVMSEQDELFLCLSTIDGMEIADVQALTFHQDGNIFSTITNGSSDELTWVVKDGASCMIRTRLDQDFFKPSFRGTKRNSVMVEGTVGLSQGDAAANAFEIELALQTSRLTSYVSGYGIVIAFSILLLLVIGAWALFVTMASISRSRPESLEPEKLLEIEEKRLMEIYTIWHHSQWSKTKPTDRNEDNAARTVSMTSSDTWSSSSSSEEEKVEIEPYDEGTVLSTPSAYAANVA